MRSFQVLARKSVKSRPESGRDDDKDDWDGTGTALDVGSTSGTIDVKDCDVATDSDTVELQGR